ncbi:MULTISPECIES: 2-hydroxychromene-2-carboxylate isomerase [unclassified Roseovarius]|uniref:2-hydroxychromene-2-carboxylate isomerase n=1 Tax=unclassified Roseovarius TaxID=2614913 RepID=UPI00273D1A34|nr:2-hydroxychromene-2-carboxylate isomerase [Roseovarius sp. MMSF_3350]
MTKPQMDFWFEFASTYSYLSVMRLPARSAEAGVAVRWRPFLLGPIFASQGWDTSPFKIYAAKGNYMWRDMERRCAALGLTFKRSDTMPQHSVLAARTAQIALETPQGIAFCQNVYLMQFAEGMNIADTDVMAACLSAARLPADLLEKAQTDANKHRLRDTTEEAMRRGLFGAPSFTVGDELFWGDDQLETALAWAVEHAA